MSEQNPFSNPKHWTDKESQGDRVLVELIIEREEIYKIPARKGDYRSGYATSGDEAILMRHSELIARINQRKKDLGIDPILEP